MIQIAPFFLSDATVKDFIGLNPVELRMSNFWVWLAGVALLVPACAFLSLNLYLVVRAFRAYKNVSSLNNALGNIDNQASMKYRIYSIAVLTILQLIIYLPDLLGHLFYKLLGWLGFEGIASETSSIGVPVLVVPLALLLPLDKWLSGLIRNSMQYQAAKFLEEIHWLVELALESFSATYLYNPYEWYQGLREPFEVQSDVIGLILEIRTKIEEAYLQLLKPTNDVLLLSALFYNKYKKTEPALLLVEAHIWTFVLTNKNRVSREQPCSLKVKADYKLHKKIIKGVSVSNSLPNDKFASGSSGLLITALGQQSAIPESVAYYKNLNLLIKKIWKEYYDNGCEKSETKTTQNLDLVEKMES